MFVPGHGTFQVCTTAVELIASLAAVEMMLGLLLLFCCSIDTAAVGLASTEQLTTTGTGRACAE